MTSARPPRGAGAPTDSAVDDLRRGPRVVAMGGGHGLAASLSALRGVTRNVTAVVTVADNGGSSGRIRREFPAFVPPGDLRMALAALAADDTRGRLWADVLQHRFRGDGELAGHAVGNLLLTGLAEVVGDQVRALDAASELVGAQGRVLPMSTVPLDIAARVAPVDDDGGGVERDGGGGDDRRDGDAIETVDVRGQVEVATARGRLSDIRLLPEDPPACEEAVAAVHEADWVILGPGSWFTSVLPHLLVPGLAAAIVGTPARVVVVLNIPSYDGEAAGFEAAELLAVLAAHAPRLRVDVVLADASTVSNPTAVAAAARSLGAELVLEHVAADDGSPRHDAKRLGAAYRSIFSSTQLADRGGRA